MKSVKQVIDINAHVQNISCQISTEAENTIVTIEFDNLGFGKITAIKFNATGYNSFGDIVMVNGKEQFFLIIQDISIEKNAKAKNLKAILPNSDIRKLELEECQICYADGSITTYDGADVKEFEIEEFETTEAEKETLDSIRDVISRKVKYLPKDYNFGWLCSCGRYNDNNNTVCSNCDINKLEIFKITDSDYVSSVIEKHRQNVKDRKEKKIQEVKEKKRIAKIRKIKIGICVIVSIILIILIGRGVVLSGRKTFSSESEMKSALQGTYTYYNDYGEASRQIIINGNTAIYKWNSNVLSDMDVSIKKWDYKNGKIYTFEDLIVTNRGYLKDGDDVYKKGGYMTTPNDFYVDNSNNYESGATVLKIKDVKIQSNSSYTICTGSVKNTGTKTYKYVQVKGAFKDSSGNVVDTDWTYAVGSEGLAPDESTTFRLSVDKNVNINSCTVSLMDYE